MHANSCRGNHSLLSMRTRRCSLCAGGCHAFRNCATPQQTYMCENCVWRSQDPSLKGGCRHTIEAMSRGEHLGMHFVAGAPSKEA